jgi:uncharacterized membrane protein
MDILASLTSNSDYLIVGRLSLFGAVGMSVPAMVYGLLDFLKIDPNNSAWRKAALHAILNGVWFMVYCTMLFYRIRHEAVGIPYLVTMALSTIGLFYSNCLGADLIISHRIGIDADAGKSSENR